MLNSDIFKRTDIILQNFLNFFFGIYGNFFGVFEMKYNKKIFN